MMINAAKGWSPKEAISEALSTRINESGNTFLELAVHRNCVEVVELIFVEDRAYQHDRGRKNKGFMRLIYTAIDKEYKDILKLLTETYEAQVSVVHKGVTDLIVAIRKRDRGMNYEICSPQKEL
ncbi:hypothetical protein POM88_019807 [Heracleum sosnowskyi]|uniref:Uncharacterized protein n=1 Tax=Heracleum sosnowskyi TaxID=360622 RepID=A0AAD8IA80_9APIA|nr:hypothetical protein POM88_019807 [Heracleum sosnowskyi]